MSTTVADPTRSLRQRATAFALLARMLGPDVSALADPSTMTALREVLLETGAPGARERLMSVDLGTTSDVERLAGTWVRWFDSGRVAAYEGSNVPATAAGITPRLADIAGFYSAYGFAVHDDRPDHIVAELEFMSILLIAEADASASGRVDQAEIAAETARLFLRDHLGTWVSAWASRVGEIEQLAPWFAVAAATAELIGRECHDRHVIPLRLSPVLPADQGLDPADDGAPECGA